jgi:predicted MPP superfamily phosphohydrolase
MQLYVNRGIGTVELPFRLNCPPEITVFTLA